MDAAGLRALQFQLDQVHSKLEKDPNNAGLKAMAVKLESLIKLSQEEPEDKFEPAPVIAPKRAAEKPRAKEPVIKPVNNLFEDQAEPNEPTSAARSSNTVIESSSAYKRAPQTAPVAPTKTEPRSSTGPVRRKHTLAEHTQKKEAEHAAKQQGWQSFQQKFGGKAPLGSRVPGASHSGSSSSALKPSSVPYSTYNPNLKPK